MLLVPIALALSAPGRAATPTDAPPVGAPAAEERTKLVLRVDGELGQEREAALTGLLGPELSSNGVTLAVERSSEPRLAWTAAARRDPKALVLAILDARDERSWALYIVDAARGRAILRRLPGGVEANAAVLEEVAAIVTSAVAAVREGLEVASTPVEAVVSDQPGGRAEPAVAPPKAPLPAAPRTETPVPNERTGPGNPRSVRPFAAVLARGATLAGKLVPGVAGEVGLGVDARLHLLVHGAMDRPLRVSTALGSFELGRSLVALQAGYAWPLGPVSLEPRVGSGVELVRRSGADAVSGIVAGPRETHARFATFAAVRARYVVTGPLALELGVDAAYAPRPIHFTSGETVLASAPPLSAGALAGIALGL